MDDNNQIVPGVYATGWIKRGPVGLIGHTKSDAMETIKHLVKDQASWWSPQAPDEASVIELLNSRGISYTNLEGWHRLDHKELELGAERGRERLKVVPRDEMLEIARAGTH
jgi:ferredoxin--NADP+ reductase